MTGQALMEVAGTAGMNLIETALPGVLLVEPKVFEDSRGFFKETFQQQRYNNHVAPLRFVQDNLSRSQKGTLRGLHFQLKHAQAKLVQVFRGAILDVAVDVRQDSPHFGQWVGVELSEHNHRQLYVPPGFAHGFSVLSEIADVFYKCTDLYHPEHERTLLWNDPDVGVDWQLDGEPVLSDKDKVGTPLSRLECYESTPPNEFNL